MIRPDANELKSDRNSANHPIAIKFTLQVKSRVLIEKIRWELREERPRAACVAHNSDETLDQQTKRALKSEPQSHRRTLKRKGAGDRTKSIFSQRVGGRPMVVVATADVVVVIASHWRD